MRSQEYEKCFYNEFLPLFAETMGPVHYTWDMFTNLARPADTQDRRSGKTEYWELKSSVGQECFDLWCESCSKFGQSRIDSFDKLVKRLKRWYEKESACGLIENPRSKGLSVKKARIRIAADLEKLNQYCPNFAPWTEKSVFLLCDHSEKDKAIVSGIKESFLTFYKKNDWNSLSEWDQERKWFYKNKKKIDNFVKNEKDQSLSMLRLMKFSNIYDESYRNSFEETIIK